MVNGAGKKCMKSLLFTTNFLLFVIGAAIFGLSLWITLDKNLAQNIRDLVDRGTIKIPEEIIDNIAQYQASLWVLVAVGAILMIVGFLGCCGAGCESILLLTLFFVIVFILAIVQSFALFYLRSGRDELDKGLYKVLEKVGENTDTEVMKQFAPIQDAFKCCGPTSDTKMKFVNFCKDKTLPDCYSAMKIYIENNAYHIWIAGIALLVVEAFALMFSCVLCRSFREYPSYSLYN